jgi:arginyl-tRNA synthetase
VKQFEEAAARIAEKSGIPFEDALRAIGIPRERDRADLALPCFPFAKKLGRAPQQIATEIAEAFAADSEDGGLIASAEATGPFVNFRVDRAQFAAIVLDSVGERFGRNVFGDGETVVIDYGSPNIAKPLLFHHLRSAVIGQALANVHRACGYKVIALNYLGDVGTAFGKLMVGIEEFGEPANLEAFKKTYVDASRGCSENEEWMARARAWAKRLEEGDETAERHWTNARAMSLDAFATVYDRLGVSHNVVDGEKMYVERAHELVGELLENGKAEVSEGGVVVPCGQKIPFLIRKSDGATLYSTRDLVAAMDRFDRYSFARMLYVVDVAQQLYFKQLFGALGEIGCEWSDRCKHIAFGQVLVDGSRTKTREGQSVELGQVLDEGERRARAIVEEKAAESKGGDLPDPDATARAVGTAAVIFGDVGFPTSKNINFEWDSILSFDGRTGPYLQYVHASACSILAKACSLLENDGGAPAAELKAGDASLLTDQTEWELLRRLAEFPDATARACRECEPSHVANFLYELAREFRSYHAAGGRDPALRVLNDDAAKQAARLRLVDAVRCALARGLEMLGITPLEQM